MINDHLLRPWPDEVAAALDEFRQGDLIERPPFFYWGVGNYPLWRPTSEELSDEEDDVVILDDDGFTHGIITTQTCDLRGPGSSTKPWLMLSPVYGIEGDPNGIRSLVDRGLVTYLSRVTGLEDRYAVADTRLEFPLEKGYLVGRQPLRGFRTEEEYLRFAEKLAENKRRPALASSIYECVLAPLRERARATSADEIDRVFEHLWELRLRVEGDRVDPIAVQLVVFSSAPPSDDLRAWFDEWWDEARVAAEDRLALLRPDFRDASRRSVSPIEYQGMIPLPLRDLSPE